MKKLVCITFVFIASFTQAQEKNHGKQKMQDYTPEEVAELQTKQLTLDLNLTEAQQKQVAQLQLENAKARRDKSKQMQTNKSLASKKELSKEEKLQMKNDRLDYQIEMKKKMKEILDDEQFTKWEKMTEKKRENRQKSMHKKRKASMGEQKK
ncbi:hypothetical protein [Xanthomarina sp. F2636L]|uniref:hypothetical protein n=1 Tax=Xanthomarina sp. F2636L TaxID=2996018 RepID=UPI00225E185A|nr:hypothetical protein [Xanthomarina sp. F2636L]MCX7552026.1 hypothetical protein [Xanthomarina sp. F2636L]